ncbi:hypothetical protein HF313_09755 [Massilia atriviolacea]|uniref:Uncharacterized protein n=1 Tax=Massilia atriviolacea TaxID=2495579 RepID=A0A430HF56_9BURK|nr:hypothetical protein [Massilia atriviolacea]RSZ56146.1 hypothetical protein EJB06_26270 [Massilia atriviolacea]
MNTDTHIDLPALHDTIVAAIRARFPALRTVAFYRDVGTDLPVPACLLDMSGFDAAPEVDPGTGQLPVMLQFKAALTIASSTAAPQLSVRVLAAAFAAFLHEKRWPGGMTGPAQAIRAYKDEARPLPDQYQAWCVEWRQVAHLGHSVWNDDGVAPTTVYLGFTPEIGIGKEDRYIEVTGLNLNNLPGNSGAAAMKAALP